jgi:hypothetical protein
MRTDLFGEEHLEPLDVARKAIEMSLDYPFYKIKTYHSGVTFFDDNDERVNLSNEYGLYAIYKNKICLYVGETFSSIYYRVYRFQKELLGLSRPDENHAAALKARMDGIKDLHNCKIRFIPHHVVLEEIDKVDSDYRRLYGHFPLDEYIAPLLEAKYNTRKVHM